MHKEIGESDGYFIDIGLCQIPIPSLLSPGAVYLMHIDEEENKFRISIEISHKLLGIIFVQKGYFQSI